MKRPLVWFMLIFCSGIIAASLVRINFPLVYYLSVVFLIFSFLSLKNRLILNFFILGLAFLLGTLFLSNSRILPNCHISKYAYYKNNNLYAIKGFITSDPIIKNNRMSFVFRTKEIQFNNLNYNCCGNIIVYLAGKKDLPRSCVQGRGLHYGEELILSGSLYRPFGFGSNKRKNYKNYLYDQGIYSIMRVDSKSKVIRLNNNGGLAVKRFALWLKQKLENTILKHVSTLPAAVLDAMILGEKRNIPALIYNSMIKSGTVHILVVSGFNVGIVTFIIILFLKLIRLPRPMRIYVAIPLLIFYCLITGASNPVVRATIMAIVFMLAYFVRREPDIYNSCAVAMIFILVFNPRQLFDIGFELSFVSVISIAYFYPKIKSLLHTEFFKIKYLRFLFDGCLVSFSAWLGTMGFIAYYFKIFSPITVLANIFIVPLATLITLCGASLIIIELICPALAPFFAYSSELAVLLLFKINTFLIKLPAAYFYLPR